MLRLKNTEKKLCRPMTATPGVALMASAILRVVVTISRVALT